MSGSLNLPEALERAASELTPWADAIRPANGDPAQLLAGLSPEGAVEVLSWLLEHEAEAAAELANAWADDEARGPQALLALDPNQLPRDGRKLLRRVRHRLRSRGFEVDAEAAPGPMVAKLPRIEDDLESAVVSGVDPRGTRVVYLVAPNPSSGARIFELLLDEERGIVGFEIYTTGRSSARKFVRELARGPGLAAAPAPAASVRALVARTAAAQPPDRALPRGLSEWRAALMGTDEAAATPGELARDALAPAEGRAALERVCERIRTGTLGPWPPAEALLRGLAEKLGELSHGRIVVSGQTRLQQLDELLREELATLYAGSLREAQARRFEENAYLPWKAGREDEARDLLAAAQALRQLEPAENPVARTLLEVALGPALANVQQEAEEEQEGSLLVEP